MTVFKTKINDKEKEAYMNLANHLVLYYEKKLLRCLFNYISIDFGKIINLHSTIHFVQFIGFHSRHELKARTSEGEEIIKITHKTNKSKVVNIEVDFLLSYEANLIGEYKYIEDNLDNTLDEFLIFY